MTSRKTRGRCNADWIERYCVRPAGPERGKPVMLTLGEIELIRRAYDENETVTVEAELGAFLVLLHLCGIEHHSEFPLVKTNIFSVWGSAGDHLKSVLTRDGEIIRCQELGLQYPRSEAA